MTSLDFDPEIPHLVYPVLACEQRRHMCIDAVSPARVVGHSVVSSWLSATPWTVACQALLSVGLCRQGYWSGLPPPLSGHLPDPGARPMSPASPALAGGCFATVPPGKPPWYSLVAYKCYISSVQSFSHVSLQPHGLQRPSLPCPSSTPRACSNSCLSGRWCHPTISSSVVPFSSHLQSFPASGFFSNESALHIRWPKYWSFSFNISHTAISVKINVESNNIFYY